MPAYQYGISLNNASDTVSYTFSFTSSPIVSYTTPSIVCRITIDTNLNIAYKTTTDLARL